MPNGLRRASDFRFALLDQYLNICLTPQLVREEELEFIFSKRPSTVAKGHAVVRK